MNNIEFCDRCSKSFIHEEILSHTCTPHLKGIMKIPVDYIISGKPDSNGDMVFQAKGLDGIIYRLVQCSHDLSHVKGYPTTFDSEKNRHRLDSSLKQHSYKVLVPYHTVW